MLDLQASILFWVTGNIQPTQHRTLFTGVASNCISYEIKEVLIKYLAQRIQSTSHMLPYNSPVR